MIITTPVTINEDFDDISLEPDSKLPMPLSRGISSIPEYSDSSFSSSSRSSTNSTISTAGEEEFYDLDDDDDDNRSSNRSSVVSDTPSDFSIAANKLNGYAITTLKSKSSITLLNPNHASAQSRQQLSTKDDPAPPLFKNDAAIIDEDYELAAATSPLPNTRRHSEKSYSSMQKRLQQGNGSSPSLSIQASQGLRVKPYTSKISGSPIGNRTHPKTPTSETGDATRQSLRKTASASTLGLPPRPSLRRSASSITNNTNNTNNNNPPPGLVLPTTKNGLTAQQRFRLRRQNSTSKLTVEQLELQCESDDGDDDLPVDALVWNVPLSPALYVKAQSQSQLTKQEPPQHRSKSASKRGSGINRQSDTLSSIKETEPTQYFNTPGLENLSEDARNLTKAFQELPTTKAAELAITKQKERPSSKLPPKRRSNDFMDPVPISKEKESVLSRTRPSWLPPKSPEEEARHLQEYKKMMALAASADKKRAEQLKLKTEARLKERKQLEKEWSKNVLPRFEMAVQEAHTRELWWKGIPGKYRPLIWKARAGNTLGITKSTYEKALARGKEAMAALAGKQELTETEEKDKKMYDILKVDCLNPLSEVGLFGKYGPLHSQLMDTLIAFSSYRPDIGYKSGLHYLAAMFLMNLTPLESFTALASTLNHSLCQAIYVRDEGTLTSYYTSFLKVLNTKLPSLYNHFKQIRLPPSAYLEPMLTTLYSQHVSIDITSRIWDVMFFEGDSFLLRVALGVLMKYEHKLYGSQEEVLKILGWGAPRLDLGDEDDFMRVVRTALKQK
ncbi:hypothetical protein D0Z00_003734 [Geotrichum galactomycetum]|uniref:Uncharacterized protein n=1 Tax=Geotrichum galactomycetum TaxID=27317 RepID=A0ACB6V0J8_9ASCO|nr:hypothetical protein D0Z00_003734 [Geotrichum candidum]